MTAHRFSRPSAAGIFLALLFAATSSVATVSDCTRPVYLTLDTGSMRDAELIAQILRKHAVRATFFLANEKTIRGDYSLEASWADYWKARAGEGHAFGSHTWRHGRISQTAAGTIGYRPQFGEAAGRVIGLTAEEFCRELRAPEEAFRNMTGRGFDRLWRAPGGHTTPESLREARQCGYAHVHWSPAGFLGDELPSDRYPNAKLLADALRNIRVNDILVAHLGIWSRRDPYAPMLDPLIEGLKARGFCFKTLNEHPDYHQSRLSLTPVKSP